MGKSFEVEMVHKIYELANDDAYQDFVFNEIDGPWEKTQYALLRKYFGLPLPDGFCGFDIIRNNDNKRKKKSVDIHAMSACSILALSKKACAVLTDLISPYGEFSALQHDLASYRAFHVSRVVKGSVIWESSSFREASYGRILYTPVLKESMISGEHLFMIEENSTNIFVSQKFRDACELGGLSGLDFSLKSPIVVQPA